MAKFIHPTAVIAEGVFIGEDVYIGPNCIIGYPAEYKDNFPRESQFTVEILGNAVITGNVTIDAGTVRNTLIKSDSFLMKGVHIGHDAIIDTGVTLSPHCCIGGHVHIQENANLGMGSIVHPRQKIGAFSMIGMGTVVPKKAVILPGRIFVGNPCKEIGINQIGLDRANIDSEALEELTASFHSTQINS